MFKVSGGENQIEVKVMVGEEMAILIRYFLVEISQSDKNVTSVFSSSAQVEVKMRPVADH